MSVIFDITHTTTYRYAQPVELGEHRVMFRPRDSHDLRVRATDLQVTPGSREIRMIHDVYSNSIAVVQPTSPARELSFVCTFTVEHTGSRALDLPLDPSVHRYPFQYQQEDQLALQHYLQPFYADHQEALRQWARQFVGPDGHADTREVLVRMNQAIRDSMSYQVRHEEGVQAPHETLARRKGSCRDFATLMIEAVRLLGYGARFVSGYIYAAELEGMKAQGATHAWLQVYLPGAGWIAFDPTNNLIGGTDLIRVAVARHASLAAPLSGTWQGEPETYLGMTVDVQVNKRT
ncbi:MAG: transglutaminase family protein [Acidobacteriota bacterium]